jgi:hypothetical protein
LKDAVGVGTCNLSRVTTDSIQGLLVGLRKGVKTPRKCLKAKGEKTVALSSHCPSSLHSQNEDLPLHSQPKLGVMSAHTKAFSRAARVSIAGSILVTPLVRQDLCTGVCAKAPTDTFAH